MDIICKRGFVEVKSSSHPHCLTQVLIQKRYADKRQKKHILYAPNISERAKQVYEKNRIIVAKHLNEIVKELKK